jgi:hypothetical protein
MVASAGRWRMGEESAGIRDGERDHPPGRRAGAGRAGPVPARVPVRRRSRAAVTAQTGRRGTAREWQHDQAARHGGAHHPRTAADTSDTGTTSAGPAGPGMANAGPGFPSSLPELDALASGPAGSAARHRRHCRVGTVEQPRRTAITPVSGEGESMDQEPRQRQRDGHQQPSPQPDGQENPHIQRPFVDCRGRSQPTVGGAPQLPTRTYRLNRSRGDRPGKRAGQAGPQAAVAAARWCR